MDTEVIDSVVQGDGSILDIRDSLFKVNDDLRQLFSQLRELLQEEKLRYIEMKNIIQQICEYSKRQSYLVDMFIKQHKANYG